MANYCECEIKARGSREALYAFFTALPTTGWLDCTKQTVEGDVYEGECKWEPDSYCHNHLKEIPDIKGKSDAELDIISELLSGVLWQKKHNY